MADKLVVIGLDGADRDALVNGINSGDLHNFREIASDGEIATLKAPLPPTTPVSMSSILTGTYPHRHGVFCFETDPKGNGGYVTYDSIGEPTLFDHLDGEKSVVSINVPMTSPPPETDGHVIGGFPSGEDVQVWPPTLKRELEEMDYRTEPSEFDGETGFVSEVFELAEKRFQIASELIDREWDLFFLMFTGDARLQHFIDDEDTIMEFYRTVDGYLGRLMEAVDDDVEVLVVSDHGFHELEVEVDIAEWLIREGYMEDGETDWSELYGHMGRIEGDPAAYPGGAYMGNVFVEDEHLEELVEKLSNLEGEKGRVFRDVFRTGELYGECDGPDVIPVPRRTYNYVARASGELFNEEPEEKKSPDREGVIIASREISGDPEAVDVLPTVLDLLGTDVPEDLDGASLVKRD